MKSISKLICACIVLLLVLQPDNLLAHTRALTDITVGHRSNDSTGTVSISNASIQQSIIPLIKWIKNTTITSENPSVIVCTNNAYLLFNVTDSLGKKSAIAVQLSETSSGNFTFTDGGGKELHIASGTGGCTSCIYNKENGRLSFATCAGSTTVRCRDELHFLLSY
ncbi:MAG: hypothetical protein ABJA78_00860 [Ferruginibacter sp.]